MVTDSEPYATECQPKGVWYELTGNILIERYEFCFLAASMGLSDAAATAGS